MKKRLFLLVLSLVAVGLAGCAGGGDSSGTPSEDSSEHVHTFATNWSYDSNTHWHASTCGHDVKSDEAPHTLTAYDDNTYESCSCGYRHDLITSLEAPKNLTYTEGVLSFEAVENAARYEVTISYGDESEPSILTLVDTTYSLIRHKAGELTVSVRANAGDIFSDATSLTVNHTYIVQPTERFEAEDCVSNPDHISVDDRASGGKYAMGFNDCGQGIYFKYYSYVRESKAVVVAYSTAAVGSYMNLFVGNSKDPTRVLFDTDTGWFGDSGKVALTQVSVTFEAGWNDVYLFKNGNSQDYPEYGGWGQLDYVEVRSSLNVYNVEDITIPEITEYRYEAEGAKWHWANPDQRPNLFDGVGSHGYLGEQNAKGDGVTFTVNMEREGTYKLKLAAGCNAGQRYFDVTVNNELQNKLVKMGNDWNIIAEDDGFLVHLNKGLNTIDFSRGDNGDWSCIDYLKIEYVGAEAPEIGTVTNLAFADNTLTFTPVEGLGEYKVVLTKEDETLLDKSMYATSIEIPATIRGENITATVYAKNGFFTASEGASIVINPGYVLDKDMKLEAEDYIVGEQHLSNDALASGGAYGLGFDNCGEGMNYRYYAYEAGERVITIAYATGAAGSKMEMRVNQSQKVTAVFTENTGWFGDSHVFATVDITVTLAKGWNYLDLYKMGTKDDNPAWGGWAQIDYILIKGTGKSFDTSELDDLVCETYRLEAECGKYKLTGDGSTPGADGNNFSGYYLGCQDTPGDGVEFKFKIDAAGSYIISFYCGGDGSRNVAINVNGTAVTNPGEEIYTLTTGNGWNVVRGDEGFNASLNEGWNTLSLRRISNELGGGWICIDYVVISLVK